MNPVCFMVMPFQRKPVPSDWKNAPSEVDCDRLWDLAFRPALLRARGKRGDNERATAIDTQVIAACRRAEERGSTDPFLPDTLFGTAFRMGDTAAFEDIVERVETGIRWRMGSTLKDAQDWIQQAPEEAQGGLKEILQRLESAYEHAH